MGILSGFKESRELVLVFDIGTSSIGGSLFYAQKSGIPKIVLSVREPILVEENLSIDRLLSLTMQTLELVSNKIYAARMGAPHKIFCVLSSPWYISQIRTITLQKNTPFTFTTKLADSLIAKEISLYEQENLAKYKHIGDSFRVIELKNIKIMLNGYETSSPLDQRASDLEMSVFVSMSGANVLNKMEMVIRKHFSFAHVKFSSFVMSTFVTVRDLYARQPNFLLVDIGGEVTEISMIKKNIFRESISFPLGRNFLTRSIAYVLGCPLNEADSIISLLKDGHADKAVIRKVGPIIDKLKLEWLHKFQESLANLSNDISVPSTIYITTDNDLADFFTETIKNDQFNQYTLTESKFEVIYLNVDNLHNFVTFEGNSIRDPFIMIDSIYINRFLA